MSKTPIDQGQSFRPPRLDGQPTPHPPSVPLPPSLSPLAMPATNSGRAVIRPPPTAASSRARPAQGPISGPLWFTLTTVDGIDPFASLGPFQSVRARQADSARLRSLDPFGIMGWDRWERMVVDSGMVRRRAIVIRYALDEHLTDLITHDDIDAAEAAFLRWGYRGLSDHMQYEGARRITWHRITRDDFDRECEELAVKGGGRAGHR